MMMRILTLALILTIQSPAFAQAPRMTTRDRDGSVKPLRLEHAGIAVLLVGDVAETTLELEFRNDGDRAVEGEFALALPEGATVSGYALDVNGAMREGVVAEKQRARNAYESVKRRMIDPGIVEREAGNIYRTKVYPVPARNTKRLRIRYTETLRISSRGLDYSLPLDFPEPLASFSCEITRSGEGEITIINAAGLAFTPGNPKNLSVALKNAKPSGTLRLSTGTPAGPRMILEDDPQPAFLLSDIVPEIAARPRPTPGTVMLVWDASASGLDRDHQKELDLLEAWFAHLGNTRVKLRFLRDQLEDAGEFDVRNGQWAALKDAIQQADYDGATFLSRLQVDAGEAEFVVFVSDGVSTLGNGMPTIATPWFFIQTGQSAADQRLARSARASSGAAIHLASDKGAAALAKLTHQPVSLISVVGDDLASFVPELEVEPGKPLRIYGILKQQRAGKLEVRYGFGPVAITTRTVSYQPGGSPAGIIRRLHAQRVLAELEKDPEPNPIIAHCKRHGLVSDFTSFIVLERLEDYANHDIPPPEPELLDAYQKLVRKRSREGTHQINRLSYPWSRKIEWFNRQFPGYESIILPRLRQVGIWKKAVESQFEPAQRDAEAFATITGWFDKASTLIAEKPKLRSKDDYQKWRQAIDELNAQGPALAKTPLHPPPAGQPLAVSVRGLVAKPGVITHDSGLTLRQAIDHAGGLHRFGSLDEVALYRNAGKIVYNALSEQFEDFPLFPADMVVVGQKHASHEGCVDAFAESSGPSDPRKEAAIRDQADIYISPSVGAEPFGRPSAGGDAAPVAIRGASDDSRALSPELTEFQRIVASGGDPASAYRKLKDGKHYQTRFYVEAARILFAAKHVSLARRVLSNPVELQPGDLSAVRAHAFWLAEFNQAEEAEAVLKPLIEADPQALPPAMDLASLHAAKQDPAAAVDVLFAALKHIESQNAELAAIALTDYNAHFRSLGKPAMPHPLAGADPKFRTNFDSDIRIAVTSTGDGRHLRFEVREPTGFVCSSAASPSPSGGWVTATDGHREYMIRHAVPGVYQITCASDQPATIRVVTHTRWGSPDQQSKVATALLDSTKSDHVGEVEFEFQPEP